MQSHRHLKISALKRDPELNGRCLSAVFGADYDSCRLFIDSLKLKAIFVINDSLYILYQPDRKRDML